MLWKLKQTLVTVSSPLCFQEGQQRFPELAGPLLDWEVHSRKEYSARRSPDASVTGLCSFWDSTPGHRISLGAEGEPVTVPPVFNACFSNTVVKISFHKRVLVPYRNIYFHDFFLPPVFLQNMYSLTPPLCNKVSHFY